MMKLVLRLVLAITAMCVATGSAHAQSGCVFPPGDQVHPSVSTVVSKVDSRFTYSYTLTVLPDSPKPVSLFWVGADSTDGTVTLNTPANWIGLKNRLGYYAWGSRAPRQGLPQGGTLAFGVTSNGLPSIVPFVARNFVESPSFPEGEAPDDCKGGTVLENSFKGSTVGPKAPPSTDRIQPVNYLISLLHDSRRLGWISTNGAHQDLLAKLVATKRKIESNDIPNARDQLQQFLDQVVQRSCQTPNCNNRPLNTDAYAVLYYNGQNLMQRL